MPEASEAFAGADGRATDYSTQPFGAGELFILVEEYVGLGVPNRPQSDKLLAAALEDELEIGSRSSSTALISSLQFLSCDGCYPDGCSK